MTSHSMNKLNHYLGLWQKEIIFNIQVLNHVTLLLLFRITFPTDLVLLINWYYIFCLINEIPILSCSDSLSVLLTKKGLFYSGHRSSHLSYFKKIDPIDPSSIISIACGGNDLYVLTKQEIWLYTVPSHRSNYDIQRIIIQLEDLYPLKELKCGESHMLLLTGKGLYGYGSNLFGQVGTGEDTNYIH